MNATEAKPRRTAREQSHALEEAVDALEEAIERDESAATLAALTTVVNGRAAVLNARIGRRGPGAL